MDNSDNSIAQMILDQQLLSAYRNGGSLNPLSNVLLPPANEVSGLTLSDRYLLQALMPSMSPQEQWLTSLELLKDTVRPSSSLFAPSFPTSSVDDAIRALGNSSLNNALLLNNSTSSFLTPEYALMRDEQMRLASMLSSGFDSLLPRNNSSSSNSLSMTLLNALSVASIGIPMGDDHAAVSNALNMIENMQSEANLPSGHAKSVETSHSTGTSNRSAISSKSSSRIHKKSKSKTTKRSCKDSVQGSNTSPTYEEAQLLFDSFATLASGDKSKRKTDSVISKASVLKYEDYASGSELTSPEFWNDVPHILSVSMSQMSLTRMKPNGKFDVPKTSELGHAALCCKHCKGVIGFGSHFFKSLRQGNHIHRIVKHVQDDCKACPEKVRDTAKIICNPLCSDSLGVTLSKSFKSEAFFEHIWNQLCKAGFEDFEKSDMDTDTVSTGTDTVSDEIVTE